ncbi:hypothetical protein KSP40_PGU003004 [Platanthera guangdongensis]|uniref:NADH dehydrogenase [ubiquinone] 1 alpha subcomplex subunit 5, mitochondrial n=1 Tax=Platanthera guangdongensis TaxID=2320717 RepID=A0ABR2MK73_9ASPA
MFLRRIMTGGMGSMLMAKLKETTGIVGLEVVPNAREVLISLYKRTLTEIKAVPEEEGYRKAVESFTNHRLRVCEEEQDWEVIEKRIACGQVEELIEEAQDELKLIAKMIVRAYFLRFINKSFLMVLILSSWWIVEWDPWGVPDDYECEVVEDTTPIPKHVPQHRPPPLPVEFHNTLEAIKSKRDVKDEPSDKLK